MKPFLICFFILVFTIFLGDVQSQTLYVDSAIVTSGNGSSWSNALKSLGDALDSAHKNPAIDSILIARGTYHPTHYPFGTSTGNVNDYTFHIRAGLEVFGGYPNGGGTRNISANPTILSGATATDSFIHVVIMVGSSTGDTTGLDGFIVEKGYFRPGARTGAISLGGFVFVYHNWGGGIFVPNSGISKINRCIIRNNHSLDNGAGIATDRAKVIIENCKIHNNIGDGIYLSEGFYLLRNNEIFNNNKRGLSSIITKLSFIGNLVRNNAGGGLYIEDDTSKIANNIIANNNEIFGGGLHTISGTHYIENNTFSKNSADFGGGFMADGASVNYLNNNIFWGNKNAGGFTDSLDADLYNKSATIIAKNNLFQIDSALLSTLPLATGSAKNLYKINPQFTGGAGADSLSILPTSPLIDKGDSSLYTWSEKLDFLNADRIQNSNIEIGAIETNSCISKIDVYDTMCFGDTIFFGGKTITQVTSSIWKDTLTSLAGCDSIVTLHLFVSYIRSIGLGFKLNCYGDSNGTIKFLTIDGGVRPYSYMWSNGSTDSSISNLKVGSYSVIITDNFGCKKYDTFAVGQPSSFMSNTAFIQSVSCFGYSDGKIKHTVTGGSPPYSFVWSNSGSKDSISNILAGTYTCTITDLLGCTMTVTNNVVQPPQIYSSMSQTICSGASYSFNGNNLTTNGVYRDTLIAANGCDSLVILNLIVKPTASSTNNATVCKGMTYLFNGVQRSTSGTYLDTFTASNGCDSFVTLNLTISSPPIITTTDSSDFATAYTWRGKSYSSAGTYFDTSKAANKCDTIFKLILTTKAAVPPAAPPILQINYVAGALIASIDSANSYQWYLCGPPMKKITGATKRTFQVSDKNKYTVVVTKNGKTDTAACASNSSIVSTNFAQGIICYPNPVFNKLSIELERKLSNADVTIYDLSGRKLWGQHFNSLLYTEINMQNFPEGTYFLQMQSDQVSHRVIKIVKRDE